MREMVRRVNASVDLNLDDLVNMIDVELVD